MVSTTNEGSLAAWAGGASTTSRAVRSAVTAPRLALALVSLAAFVAVSPAAPAFANPGQTTRESVSASGAEANDLSVVNDLPSISGNGLVTAFSSRATNLVPGDTNGQVDVFVRDRTTGTVQRASVSAAGAQADGDSASPSIAATATRYVAFSSSATNLVAADANGASDIFVRDRQGGATVRVSVAGDGSEATGDSTQPSISADGRFVAFQSSASNLVAGDTNAQDDIFVHDRDADTDGILDETAAGGTATTRVSVASDGTQSAGVFGFSANAAISASGRFVAFQSRASNLVAGDTNNRADIFVRDRDADNDGIFDEPDAGATETTRVSVTDAGAQALLVNDPFGFLQSGNSLAISGDGTQVAFQSTADNLVPGDANNVPDVFVRDRTAGRTIRLSNGFSNIPSLSFDGRLVSFFSGNDVFVRDRDADADGVFDETAPGGTTTTVESVASDGTPGNQQSFKNAISADGSRLLFESPSSNLVPGDTNNQNDVFVHRLSTPAGTRSLEVFRAGDGSGTVTSSPAGIACGSDCFEEFPTGATVALTAAPGANSSFTGFSGAGCGTATTCTVTMDQARSVIATFDLIRHVLTVAKAGDGQGTVTSSPAGIDCGADCSESVVQGTAVTLTAKVFPGSPGYTFAGFSGGGCSGSAATCTVTLDQAKTVTATFERTRHALTVSKDGDGQGTVTSSPTGIDCGSDCSQDYLEGTEVTLTATPAAAFAGFSGACTGTDPCTVTMSRARSVTATFENTNDGVPPAPGAPAGPAVPVPAAPAAGKATAKLEVARARVSRSSRRLDVLAPISKLASGDVRVEFFAAGQRARFSEHIDSGKGQIRLSRVISRAQAAAGTGILTISYAGDSDTRAQEVRLRAASQHAALKLSRPQIVNGHLRASGTVTARARGVVRVQIEYVADAKTETLELTAPIRAGRWKLDEALSQSVRDAIARRTGSVHSYTLFTGYLPPRIRGEMQSYQIIGDR